jgi:outer membrane protein TolC
MGYYKNYRNQLKLEQGLFPGGNVFGQYRSGDGNFPVWYGERETNEGGEFKLGLISPLLRDRAIDQRRSDLFQATLRRQQVDPMVQSQLLEYTYFAADAYWSWVAAGLSLDAQEELLRVTVERNRVYEERVREGDLAQIELIQNERLIASREAKVIEARRKLQQSAIKLSLFLRDSAGNPVLVPDSARRSAFPEIQLPSTEQLASDIAEALDIRPELRELDFQQEQAKVDLAYGQNLRLPALNVVMEASKDVGAAASSKGDKTPFELEAGLLFDVPLQRRKADGKIREAEGKLNQIAAKRRFTENKVTIQVQDAMSALVNAHERLGRAQENHRLARQLEKAERDRFEAQDSDLLRVAIQETAEIEAALSVVEAQAELYKAEAAYRASRGVNPMDVPDDF